MDNQKNQNLDSQQNNEGWIDDLLEKPETGEEILPDEDAIEYAGLSSPDELDVDQIIRDTIAEIENESRTDSDSDRVSPQPDQKPDSQSDEPPLHQKESSPSKAEASEVLPNSEAPEDSFMTKKKSRPRYKAKDNIFGLSHLLATVIWLAVIIVIGVSLGNIVWVCASDVLAFKRSDQEVTITVEQSDTMEQIADKLHTAGLIKYPNLFCFYADLTDAREDIEAGTFTLNTIYDYHALVNLMSSDNLEQAIVEVVIPEGYTCAQIFSLLEEKEVCSAADLEAWASDGELDEYWFLEGVTRGTPYCLEGFLFPDTYEFYTHDDPRRILEKMLNDFDYRFDDNLRSSLIALNDRLQDWMIRNGYDEEYIEGNPFSLHQLVTVASLIEKETANTLESYTISSVIYNRLTNQAEYPYLNIDAAILYALGEHKEELTAEDLKIDSPYNTYLNPGLTPGPICNPGLHSLNAASDPDDTDYHYYAMDPSTGTHHFSETIEEHNRFLESLEDE